MRKSYLLFAPMSFSTNKLKSHMLLTCKNFVLRFYEERKFASGNGRGEFWRPSAPFSLRPWCYIKNSIKIYQLIFLSKKLIHVKVNKSVYVVSRTYQFCWSVIKWRTDSTTSTVSGQTNGQTSGQTSTTSKQTNGQTSNMGGQTSNTSW